MPNIQKNSFATIADVMQQLRSQLKYPLIGVMRIHPALVDEVKSRMTNEEHERIRIVADNTEILGDNTIADILSRQQ